MVESSNAALKKELKESGSKLIAILDNRVKNVRNKGKIFDTDTGGWYITIGAVNKGVSIELWLDTYRDGKTSEYWIGLFSRDERAIEAFVTRLRPKVYIDWDNVEWGVRKVRGGSATFIKDGRSIIPSEVIFHENYIARKGYGCFIGQFMARSKMKGKLSIARRFIEKLLDSGEEFAEGAFGQVTRVERERDKAARAACIRKHGHQCKVCGVQLDDVYGPIAKGFIHVHHLQPISKGKRVSNTRDDLIPVCPNCHAMLHVGTRDRPRPVREVQKMLRQR
jgi:hypothetical protein